MYDINGVETEAIPETKSGSLTYEWIMRLRNGPRDKPLYDKRDISRSFFHLR